MSYDKCKACPCRLHGILDNKCVLDYRYDLDDIAQEVAECILQKINQRKMDKLCKKFDMGENI